MKVFISWSGPRSKAAARALHQWIPSVFQNVEPWMSEKDVKAGAMWLNEIIEGLKNARFGIVCVTPENQNKPWIHFEAGAIAKEINNQNFLCPYLISMQGSNLENNPLTNFQYKQADEKGTRELVESINQVLEKPLKTDILQQTFELWWPNLHKLLNEIPDLEGKQEVERSSDDIMKEILELVRLIVRSPHITKEEGLSILDIKQLENEHLEMRQLFEKEKGG